MVSKLGKGSGGLVEGKGMIKLSSTRGAELGQDGKVGG